MVSAVYIDRFGAGTIAARKFQREELDAAMARNLFSRELAMSYMVRELHLTRHFFTKLSIT